MPTFDQELDTRGLACPMPLVKARKEVNQLRPGQVLKVLSTDRGSVADFQGWAKTAASIELVTQETKSIDGKDVYIHYLKRVS